MQSTNEHKLNNNPVRCGNDCDGTLYWVDGKSHYCVCNKCSYMGRLETLVCSRCKAPTLCTPKFINYAP